MDILQQRFEISPVSFFALAESGQHMHVDGGVNVGSPIQRRMAELQHQLHREAAAKTAQRHVCVPKKKIFCLNL